MAEIRVLLAEMPRMLHDIVTDIVSSQPDMLVAGPPASRDDLARAVRHSSADVVIAGQRGATEPNGYGELLVAFPRLKVLSIAGDGRRTSLHEMRPCTVPLGEVSVDELVEAIRAAVHGEGA